MGLLILAFPVLEIWGLFFFGARIGFVNTVFWLLAAAVLGFGLIRAQGLFLLGNFQNSLAKGQVPTQQIFHSLLIFIGGALFIIPGFFSDFVGLLLVLPGTRHLAVKFVRSKLEKKMREGSFRMASFGNMGGFGGGNFGGGFGGFGTGPKSGGPNGDMFRDVTPQQIGGEEIIDVTPIKRPEDND